MKLVLISGGQKRENRKLHEHVVALCRSTSKNKARKNLRMTYIPFCAENSKLFFSRIMRRYRAYGISDFHCLAADAPFSKADLKRALTSDVIYLAGGNTYYFLHHLRRAGLTRHLQRFARRGGVLVGLRAGAIIMTPTINLAGVPEFDADKNEIGLRDLHGLNLTAFEFSPHYSPSKKRMASLLAYSKKTTHPIYACPDGGGMVVDGDKITIIGKAVLFFRGHMVRLHRKP